MHRPNTARLDGREPYFRFAIAWFFQSRLGSGRTLVLAPRARARVENISPYVQLYSVVGVGVGVGVEACAPGSRAGARAHVCACGGRVLSCMQCIIAEERIENLKVRPTLPKR